MLIHFYEFSKVFYSVGYEHRSLEILLGSLENLPARRALELEMLEKNFARISLGSIGAWKNLCSSSLGSIFYARNVRITLGLKHKK